MKKNYLLFIFPLLFICFSCQDEAKEIEVMETENSSNYRIPLSEALETANAIFAEIEMPHTRSIPRRVKSVEIFGNQNLATRSVQDIGLDTLVYFVNYENDEGFAVLGADRRIDNIFAFSDQGSFSLADTLDHPGLDIFLDRMKGKINFALNNYDENKPINTRAPTPENSGAFRIYKHGPYIVEQGWDQGKPFNKYLPIIDPIEGKRASAGCGNIALSQLLVHHQYPATIYDYENKRNYSLDWNEIKKVYTPYNYTDAGIEQVANLVRILNQKEYLNAKYTTTGTGSGLEAIRATLRKLNYGRIDEYEEYNFIPIFIHFESEGQTSPVIVTGFTKPNTRGTGGEKVGHGWLITGALTLIYKYGGTARWDPAYHEWKYFIYCNWGWGRTANGWFEITTGDDTFYLPDGPDLMEGVEYDLRYPDHYKYDLKMMVKIQR